MPRPGPVINAAEPWIPLGGGTLYPALHYSTTPGRSSASPKRVIFSSPNELDSHMKQGQRSYTESKDSGPLVLLGQREASSVSEAWEATISRACPSPRSISG